MDSVPCVFLQGLQYLVLRLLDGEAVLSAIQHRVRYSIKGRMWRIFLGGLLQNHQGCVFSSSGRGRIVGMAMELSYEVVETPMGPFTVGASESAMHEAYFEKLAATVSMCGQSHAKQPVLAMAKEQVEQYFAGKRSTFSLPLVVQGTPFQRKAWAALDKILYGKAITYSEQADLIGKPGKAHAVGMANGQNPVCLIVPCHQIVGKNGTLTSYAFGLDIKKSLLNFELRLSLAIV